MGGGPGGSGRIGGAGFTGGGPGRRVVGRRVLGSLGWLGPAGASTVGATGGASSSVGAGCPRWYSQLNGSFPDPLPAVRSGGSEGVIGPHSRAVARRSRRSISGSAPELLSGERHSSAGLLPGRPFHDIEHEVLVDVLHGVAPAVAGQVGHDLALGLLTTRIRVVRPVPPVHGEHLGVRAAQPSNSVQRCPALGRRR